MTKKLIGVVASVLITISGLVAPASAADFNGSNDPLPRWSSCNVTYTLTGVSPVTAKSVLRQVGTLTNIKFKPAVAPAIGKLTINQEEGYPGDFAFADVYAEDGWITSADVYVFDTARSSLVREVFRSVGLEYSDDPKSVMYPETLRGQIITKKDYADLKDIRCGTRPTPMRSSSTVTTPVSVVTNPAGLQGLKSCSVSPAPCIYEDLTYKP